MPVLIPMNEDVLKINNLQQKILKNLNPIYPYVESEVPFFLTFSKLLRNKDFKEIYSNHKINITITSIHTADNLIIDLFGKVTIYNPLDTLEFPSFMQIAYAEGDIEGDYDSIVEKIDSEKLKKALDELSIECLPIEITDVKITNVLDYDDSSNTFIFSDSDSYIFLK